MQLCDQAPETTFQKRSQKLKEEFSVSQEEFYKKIIEFGTHLLSFDAAKKTEANLVKGCQSIMYLHTEIREKRLYFSAYSDALISSGLAALLLFLYNGEKPEVILRNPPHILEQIGIAGALSPSRANGLASLYIHMKERAIKELMTQALASP